MKIALVHDRVGGRAGGGGGVRQMLGLGTALTALGHHVTVVCHDFDPASDFAAGGDVEVRAVRTGEIPALEGARDLAQRFWRGMPRVAALVPEDADVVNAHEWPALRAGRIGARRAGAPLVWTRNDETVFERGVIPEETSTPGTLAGRVARSLLGAPDALDARRAAAVVVLDTRNARMVRRAFRREARIVRSGPHPSFFDPPDRAEARARLGVPEDAFLVLGVGILFPHRRFEDLIEAMALLREPAGVRALVVGSDHADPGYADRLAALVREGGVEDRVTLERASISDTRLRDAYAAADLLVFPNQRQTWGLAPLEALASRTPVVVSAGAGVHEVLEGRPGVAVVPPERPDAIARAIDEARAAPPAAGDLEQTRAWIRAELSGERYARGMLAIFEEAIGGRAR